MTAYESGIRYPAEEQRIGAESPDQAERNLCACVPVYVQRSNQHISYLVFESRHISKERLLSTLKRHGQLELRAIVTSPYVGGLSACLSSGFFYSCFLGSFLNSPLTGWLVGWWTE